MCNIIHADCLDAMREMPDNSVDAVVTDPPYGLSFMGRDWDHGVPGEPFWREALRVAKPGAHLLAFGGTRKYHRLAVAIEDAGWAIRDCIMWVYGSGFPKSLNVSKAIDKAAGAEREVVVNTLPADLIDAEREVASKYSAASNIGKGSTNSYITTVSGKSTTVTITAPATDAAKQWDGWGTALKPAIEPIVVARKPFKGTVAANVLEWGTGALNIQAARIDAEKATGWGGSATGNGNVPVITGKIGEPRPVTGRWPANLIHDGSDEATEGMGDAKRYFYCAKASKKDRDEGCEELILKRAGSMSGRHDGSMGSTTYNRNHHPTVKPTALMRYLCRLVTPPGGVVLDPFMGSGSTGKAAILEGFDFIGIEKDAEYIEIARARIAHAQRQREQELF